MGVTPRKKRTGEEHTPEGSDDGEDGFLGRREFADEELLLDLQPDEEEEDRHQGIVDDLTMVIVWPMWRKSSMRR